MEFIVDTIDLKEIAEAVDFLPIVGVTSNPSIVAKTKPEDFFAHMREIRKIIGKERSLHIQVIATEAEKMVEEAEKMRQEIDEDIYIKVPASYEGIKAMKLMKAKGFNVTATAVYDLMQGYMSLAAGVDCIIPYINRIGNLGTDPYDLIDNLSTRITVDNYDCKIIAASIKGVQQVRDSFNSGAHGVTVPLSILKATYANPSIAKAVNDFNTDWYGCFGEGKGICEL